MKILFLNLYSNKIARGAESFAHELADHLSPTHQVTFAKGNSSLMPTNKFSGSIISKIRKRLFLDKPALQVLVFSLQQIPQILRSNYHIIIPLNGFWQVLILKLIQPFKGFKIIITGHSGPGWDERWNLYLHPNVFVATTKPTLQWAQKTCPWTTSTLIPYGINPHPGIKHPGVNYPGVEKLPGPRILCPSALVPYKRVDLAIQAVSQMKTGSLIILGQGPLKAKLAKQAKRLLPNRHFITAVPYQHMSYFYNLCDLVTLPSDPQENSPMVFLEALAAGKPVVTTDAPRTRWALESAGFYTDPANIKAYAKEIQKALQSKPNTQKPLEKFYWPKVINQYNQLFKSLLTH